MALGVAMVSKNDSSVSWPTMAMRSKAMRAARKVNYMGESGERGS